MPHHDYTSETMIMLCILKKCEQLTDISLIPQNDGYIMQDQRKQLGIRSGHGFAPGDLYANLGGLQVFVMQFQHNIAKME